MGIGSSKDEASQSQKNGEPNQGQPQYIEEKTETQLRKMKSKTEEISGEKQVELKLPFNYELILRAADSPIDTSSTDKLYDQLCNGVFLNQKKTKYWVERKSNSNCFFLFARALSITWAEDCRYWHWLNLHETSDMFVEVAELFNVCWLEVLAKFDTTKLSPNVMYEVAFVIMLKEPSYGWELPVNFRLTLPNGTKQEHKENLLTKPRAQWIEIPVGEFISSTENVGEIEIYMYEYEGGKWKKGLLVKGVTIRPKN